MSDLNKFSKLVDDIWELVFGTVRRPEVNFKGMMKIDKGYTTEHVEEWKKYAMTKEKPKRARTKTGRYKGDDKSTKDFNEAWVGGKSPKKKKRKK